MSSAYRYSLCTLQAVALFLLSAAALCAGTWQLADGVQVQTASVEQGRVALGQRDAFLTRLGPLERAIRLNSTDPVSRAEFLRHITAQVQAWEPEQEAKLQAAVAAIAAKIEPYKLPWPETILLVRTTGREEPGASGYCRGQAIVLPTQALERKPASLVRLLTHELFHVLSNQNPKLRQKLYAIVGFEPCCREVELPEPLATRRLTNPDAPRLEYYARIEIDGQMRSIVPVLYSKHERYDPELGKTIFDYLEFRLLALEQDGAKCQAATNDAGEPILYAAKETPGYFEAIGRNTGYIIHPEEVLAENFVLLLAGKQDVPTPRILEEMQQVFRQQDARPAAP